MQCQQSKTFQLLAPDILQNPQYIPPDDIAQTSQYDQQHRDQIDHGLKYIAAQTVFRHNIHSGVAEGRYGIKNRNPYASESVSRHKYCHVQKSSASLHHQSTYENLAEEFHDSGDIIQIKYILQHPSVTQSQSSVQSHHHTVHDRNDSQTSQLDQKQDHDLSPDAPGGICGNRHQTGHTYGCGSRK